MSSKISNYIYAVDYQNYVLQQLLSHVAKGEPVPPDVLEDMNTATAKVQETREGVNGQENWEEVAVYFAECEAATAYTFGTTKSLSKYETDRHASICTALAESLKHGMLLNKRPSERDRAIERLKEAAEVCRKKTGTANVQTA